MNTIMFVNRNGLVKLVSLCYGSWNSKGYTCITKKNNDKYFNGNTKQLNSLIFHIFVYSNGNCAMPKKIYENIVPLFIGLPGKLTTEICLSSYIVLQQHFYISPSSIISDYYPYSGLSQ